MKYECAVIGGGVSGLTSALIMARQGYRTALLETSRATAPTIRGFTRRGLYFDTGFHYAGGLGRGEPLDIFFRYLGISGKIETHGFDPDGFDTFRCLDPVFEFRLPNGYDRIGERLREAFPGEAGAIEAYLGAVRETYHSQPYLDLSREVNPGLSGITGQSLAEFIDSLTGNPMLRCLLSMHCLLHGACPEEVPFTVHACVAGSYYESASGIRGGGRSLARAFDACLEEAGVEVIRGAEVKEIFLSGKNSVRGLRYGEDLTIECETCISTVHPRTLLGLVPAEAFRPVYRKRLLALTDTCSAIVLYMESDLPPEFLDGRNLLLFSSPGFIDPDDYGPVAKRPLFVTRAPQEGTGATTGYIVVCPEPNMATRQWAARSMDPEDAVAYRSYKDEMTRQVMECLESSVPEMKGRITHVECATPLTMKRFTGSPTGSIYGVKHTVDQFNPLPATRVKGLFLAGQAVTAAGVMGAVVSAFMTCGSIVGHEKLMEDLRPWA